MFSFRDLNRNQPKQDSQRLCPSPEEIPAITAVVQDPQLFGALLRCLSSSPAAETEPIERTVGRKRSLSFNAPTTKMAKLTHSPIPSSVTRITTTDVSNLPHKSKPSFSVPALAATIIYAAFQHLDHWPALLVKAYADDTFGPRAWVDDARCRRLVDNLALAHAEQESSPSNYEPNELVLMANAAALVADSYRKFEYAEGDSSIPSPPNSASRRSSMSSNSSSAVVVASGLKTSGSGELLGRPSVGDQGGDDSDSDSGEEEEHIVTTASASAIARKRDGGDSSSSGEEDEEVLLTTNSKETGEGDKLPGKKMQSGEVQGATISNQTQLYPIRQANLNLKGCRQRFFGDNRDLAQELIASALQKRIDVKSKQNSGLLQRLPAFATIPMVRSLVASNLAKWLQSPALAGLARSLFAATVNGMKSVDPPLPDDIRAIDSILAMKLKANQVNTHIENVTDIARKVPTASVVRHMYSTLIREEIGSSGPAGVHDSSGRSMIAAIHGVVPAQISYDAIASTLLMVLVHPPENMSQTDSGNRASRDRLIKKLRRVIRLIATELGSVFDGYHLMEALFSLDVSSETWSRRDEEDKARMMFQCITLSAAAQWKDLNNEREEISSTKRERLREALMSAKKLLLTWCCTDYGPGFSERIRKRNRENREDDHSGAGAPDFRSALGSTLDETIPSWLNTMRCLLFAEDAGSELLRWFVVPDGTAGDEDPEWVDEASRIQVCCDYGGDITDELLWIVIKSSTAKPQELEPEMGIELIENLIEGCGKHRKGELLLNDPMLVWELYNLVKYTPQGTSARPNKLTNGSTVRDIPRYDVKALVFSGIVYSDNCSRRVLKSQTGISWIVVACNNSCTCCGCIVTRDWYCCVE